MNGETDLGYRERAGLVGRAALAISIGPAVFLLWQAVGLPSIGGLDLGGPTVRADDGVVVRLTHRPGAAFAPSPHRATAATPAARRRHRPATAALSKSASVQPRVSAPPASEPRSGPAPPSPSPKSTPPQAPTGATPAPAPAAPADSGSTQPVATPNVPVPVQLPPLPVQLPAAPIPQVAPPLPPPVTTVVSNLTPPGLP